MKNRYKKWIICLNLLSLSTCVYCQDSPIKVLGARVNTYAELKIHCLEEKGEAYIYIQDLALDSLACLPSGQYVSINCKTIQGDWANCSNLTSVEIGSPAFDDLNVLTELGQKDNASIFLNNEKEMDIIVGPEVIIEKLRIHFYKTKRVNKFQINNKNLKSLTLINDKGPFTFSTDVDLYYSNLEEFEINMPFNTIKHFVRRMDKLKYLSISGFEDVEEVIGYLMGLPSLELVQVKEYDDYLALKGMVCRLNNVEVIFSN